MRMVLIPQFNPKKIKQYITKYKLNVFVAVPTVYDYMLKMKFGKRELRRIKGAGSGGDMVSPELKKNLNDFLAAHGSKGCMYNGYGLTEAGGCAVFPPSKIAREGDIVGFPMPDTEIVILNTKTGKPVKTGEDGEIVLRGLTIMKEYLDDPVETQKAFVKIGTKKYLKTGDLGYLDERGALHFKGRIKRMIITNGYNVYPSNIEDVTRKSKLVEKCACIGVPDKLRGEIVKVFIVPAKDAHERAIKKDLNRIYKQHLAKYEIPREMRFVEDLPKTKLGKVDFLALKDYD
jgi:long-chain acyl-CoA synthetase